MRYMSQVAPNPVRFTVEEYVRMSDAGLLGQRRTELVGGRIRKMAPQEDRHMWSVSKIARLLVHATTLKDTLIVQGTLYLDEHNAPEPDFHLFDVPVGTPRDRLPLPILVIEVSHTTYRRDSGTKLRLYARAGIPDYWLVNLGENRIEVYRKPANLTGKESDWRYASVDHLAIGEIVAMLKRPKVRFKVDAMLA
jgi:Uma2 family endonuclease